MVFFRFFYYKLCNENAKTKGVKPRHSDGIMLGLMSGPVNAGTEWVKLDVQNDYAARESRVKKGVEIYKITNKIIDDAQSTPPTSPGPNPTSSSSLSRAQKEPKR